MKQRSPSLRRTVPTEVRDTPGIERLPRRSRARRLTESTFYYMTDAPVASTSTVLASRRAGRAVPLSDVMPDRGPFLERKKAR